MMMSEDACVQDVEKKEDNLSSSNEEDEWDKLLRVRYCSGILLYLFDGARTQADDLEFFNSSLAPQDSSGIP
ncbi:hypothetical protein BC332_28259 [Capsicum chinense]|nr:hypothetical protein BC332_28259 [Capsicum chinense]